MAGSSNGRVVPAAFRPPVDSQAEFIKRRLDDEDERIEVGVAIVGGGPAGLACANRLLQRLADEPELMERLGEVPVAVIEKGKACGAHNLSGAMMRPSGLQELFPDVDPSEWPPYGQVDRDTVYWMLSPSRALPLKPTPPPFRNHGNWVVSVAKLSRWMAEKAEAGGGGGGAGGRPPPAPPAPGAGGGGGGGGGGRGPGGGGGGGGGGGEPQS